MRCVNSPLANVIFTRKARNRVKINTKRFKKRKKIQNSDIRHPNQENSNDDEMEEGEVKK